MIDASPKRDADNDEQRVPLPYEYYAAFSHQFALQALRRFKRKTDLVLDPWNGRGTTTTIAASENIPSIGFDLNPAMVCIANGRLAAKELAELALDHLSLTPTQGR